jgi:hypothetical protein
MAKINYHPILTRMVTKKWPKFGHYMNSINQSNVSITTITICVSHQHHGNWNYFGHHNVGDWNRFGWHNVGNQNYLVIVLVIDIMTTKQFWFSTLWWSNPFSITKLLEVDQMGKKNLFTFKLMNKIDTFGQMLCDDWCKMSMSHHFWQP